MSGLRFAGYAALFDRTDRGGDIVRRGAFARAVIAARLPLLWQHRPDVRIGVVEHIAEDRRGLRIIGRIDGAAHDAMQQLASGAVTGLSFGYRVRRSAGSNPRELIDLDLLEISMVTMPMMPGAKVHLARRLPP